MSYKKYLFDYYHEGSNWGLEIIASSEDDARARVRQLQYAKLLGVIEMEIPAQFGFLAKATCAIRNWAAKILA